MKALYFLLILLLPVAAIAQDVYEVKFVSGLTQHRAALVLWSDGSGRMRVRFFSNGSTRMVEQYINTENTSYGIRLTGYNPVYPGTSVRYPTYNADNFYLSRDENGNVSITNIDDDGNIARCNVRTITGAYAIQSFLSDFDWTLN